MVLVDISSSGPPSNGGTAVFCGLAVPAEPLPVAGGSLRDAEVDERQPREIYRFVGRAAPPPGGNIPGGKKKLISV